MKWPAKALIESMVCVSIDAHCRALRVILLEDGETVHNAFFDRDFQE